MKKLILFLILLVSINFAQSRFEKLGLLMENSSYTPPTGYEIFIDSEGNALKTSDGEYFLVRIVSQYSEMLLPNLGKKNFALLTKRKHIQ